MKQEVKMFTDQELIQTVDDILRRNDKDDNGVLSYYEYVAALRNM